MERAFIVNNCESKRIISYICKRKHKIISSTPILSENFSIRL
jgi:hypothetical protein